MSGYIGFKNQSVVFPLATTTSPGLMSAADKAFFINIDTVSELVSVIKNGGAATANTANTLIARDANGNFAANAATFQSINVNSIVVDNTTSLVVVVPSQVVLDINLTSLCRSFKYTIQAITATEYQISELLVIHNGTDSFLSAFGDIYTGTASLASFSTDINTGNVRLLVTTTNANTTLKFSKIQFA